MCLLRRSILLLFLICYFSGLNASGADTTGQVDKILNKIENKMSRIKTLKCSFTQTKHLSIMNKPIIIKGKIYIKPPGYFAWYSTSPVKFYLVIKGHELTQWDEDSDSVVNMDLREKPMFRVIVSQMKNWVSGAYTKQAEDYNIKIIRKEPLTLKFIPKDDAVTYEYIKSVQVKFRRNLSYISAIDITEKNNDTTRIKFNNIVLNSPLPETPWSAKPDV